MAIALLVPAMGWSLLHFVWQGLVVGALTALLLRLLRDASPRWRYAVCAMALFICLCMPLTYLMWSLNQSGSSPSEYLTTTDVPVWQQMLQARMPALVVAWSLGVGLMMLRLSLGLVWVSQLRRHAVFAPAIWQERLDTMALRMGLQRRVQLALHASVSGPVTVGFWKPIILVPASLLSGMPGALLEALLAHELAHVQRWDYLVNLLQSLVEGLLFFHPVIWWLSRRMRVEREQVADELGALLLNDPADMALALSELSLQTPTSQPGLIMSARGGLLFKRIERLLAPPPDTAGWKLALPALLVACVSMPIQATSPDPMPAVSAASLLQLPVNARHVLVLDETGGKVLMAKDADAVVPIASLAKLVTAMVVLDARLDPHETLRIAREDMESGTQEAGLLGAGSEIPRATALQMALMSSENRAATLLARTYPGGSDAFAQAVRSKIRSLGLTRTTITDPTGATPANTSTATELATIVAAAARYPEITEITSRQRAEVAVDGQKRELRNTNALVGGQGWDIRLSKTGSSAEAGRCLTMRLRSGDKDFTVVLLHADDSEQRSRDAGHIRDALARSGATQLPAHFF